MVPFAGWSMPVKYTSDVAEHNASRATAGLFDISHMAQLAITGPDAAAFLDYALAGRLSKLAPLQSKYTMMLTPTGGIIDDLIVTNTHLPAAPEGPAPEGSAPEQTAPTAFLIVANAANRGAVVRELLDRRTTPQRTFEVDVTDTGRALIAVQGPKAEAILADLVGTGELVIDPAAGVDLSTLRYYRTAPATFRGSPITLSRTGYTGEDGFELSVDPAHAVELWDALRATGEEHGLTMAGLAARDTLRLEAGMPLYGQELTRATLPAQAGLGRIVATSKEDFVGRDAVLAGPPQEAPTLVGLSLEGRRAGRTGYRVIDPAGDAVGEVTSGVLSPTLDHPIAMAYVPPSLAELGTNLAIDVRGTAIPATVVALPFYRRAKEA